MNANILSRQYCSYVFENADTWEKSEIKLIRSEIQTNSRLSPKRNVIAQLWFSLNGSIISTQKTFGNDKCKLWAFLSPKRHHHNIQLHSTHSFQFFRTPKLTFIDTFHVERMHTRVLKFGPLTLQVDGSRTRPKDPSNQHAKTKRFNALNFASKFKTAASRRFLQIFLPF